MTPSTRARIAVAAALVAVLAGGLAVTPSVEHTAWPGAVHAGPPSAAVAAGSRAVSTVRWGTETRRGMLPGMPPVADPHNVYAAAGAGMFSAAANAAKPLIYVPHVKSGDVSVIDPEGEATEGEESEEPPPEDQNPYVIRRDEMTAPVGSGRYPASADSSWPGRRSCAASPCIGN